jgi:hypothetical protein
MFGPLDPETHRVAKHRVEDILKNDKPDKVFVFSTWRGRFSPQTKSQDFANSEASRRSARPKALAQTGERFIVGAISGI